MDKKTLLVGLGSFLLILMVGVVVMFFGKPASFRGTTFGEPYPVAPEIELTRSDGTSFRLSAMRGDVILVFFGYTSCPDVCPTTMAELKLALAELNEEDAAQVKVLFITVDPKRDTPEHMQEYVDRFNKSFIGLSGTEAELDKVWKEYGVFRQEVPGSSAAGYTVDHTARVTVIDQDGNMRISFGFDAPMEDVVHDLKLILK